MITYLTLLLPILRLINDATVEKDESHPGKYVYVRRKVV